MIASFKEKIRGTESRSWERHKLSFGIVYTVIMFCAYLHGSEGLKEDLKKMVENISRGDNKKPEMGRSYLPRVIILLG